MREFEAIAKYFKPLSGQGSLGLLDDAALIQARHGFDSVITTDVLVENIHFLSSARAADIAFKALAVNVSDCIAKGAKPHGYFVGLSVPASKATDTWFASFAEGLKNAQTQFECVLLGGDTTSSQVGVTICITVMGHVPEGCMIKRSDARVGDSVYVTGYIGDAALGLICEKEHLEGYDALRRAYLRPSPPIHLMQNLVSIASASADISDGLVADAKHVAAASEVGIRVNGADVPLSSSAYRFLSDHPEHSGLPFIGGDDYQTLFTVSTDNEHKVTELAAHLNHKVTKIGVCTEGKDVEVIGANGQPIGFTQSGYEHFRETSYGR